MIKLALDSERFPATGAISGAGLQKLLGAPSFNLLQTVVREAVQNSVDAKKDGEPGKVVFHCRHLTARQVEILKSQVFASLPPKETSGNDIRRFLEGPRPRVLEISDFGSSGLGGPTRADQVHEGRDATNFIDFLRNVGVERNTVLGGGTYGYGKVSLYRASRCSTIIVDTRTSESGDAGRRFMACHLGGTYSNTARGKVTRHTGRHWWGVRNQSIVDPVEGREAKTLSEQLGFATRTQANTGTSILILDPDIDGEADAEPMGLDGAASEIVRTLLWNYWPRMMRTIQSERKVEFQVLVDGVPISVPNPEQVPPLDLFCEAMRNLTSGEGNTRDIAYRGSSRILGRLSLVKGLYQPGEIRGATAATSSVAQRSSHIALMRPVDFVVKYLKGPPLPDSRLEWAGVFRAGDHAEVERAFADAEPPAHDDWMPESMADKRKKSWVNVALRDLQKIASEFPMEGQAAPPGGGMNTPLGELAQQLGSILPGNFGEGAGPRGPGSGGSGGTRKLLRVSRPEFERLQEVDGGTVAWFKLEYSGFTPSKPHAIRLEPLCSTDGGGTVDSDESAGLETPTIYRIVDEANGKESAGDTYTPTTRDGNIAVAVRVPSLSAVVLKASPIGVTPA